MPSSMNRASANLPWRHPVEPPTITRPMGSNAASVCSPVHAARKRAVALPSAPKLMSSVPSAPYWATAKRRSPAPPAATILPSGRTRTVDASAAPDGNSVLTLPSPPNEGSRAPGVARAGAADRGISKGNITTRASGHGSRAAALNAGSLSLVASPFAVWSLRPSASRAGGQEIRAQTDYEACDSSVAASLELSITLAPVEERRYEIQSTLVTWTGLAMPFRVTSRDSDVLNPSRAAEIVSRLAKISPPSARAAILAALWTSPPL